MNDLEQTTDEIEEVSPWKDAWIRPRKTIDWIIDNYSSSLIVIILIYLGGVYFGIGRAELKNLGDKNEVGTLLTSFIFKSGLGGLVTYTIWIWAIDFCASWFGGKGNLKKTQTAFAWAMLPMVMGIVLTLIEYLLFEDELFTSETPNINGSDFLMISQWILGILKIMIGVWHIVLLVAMISQVQRFSIIKAIASIVTGFLFLILPLIGLFFIYQFSFL